MTRTDLTDLLSELMGRHPVPGAGIGVWHNGRVELAFTGITSVENPLPVDHSTRFQIGSVSKTYTATAVMRLVSEGRVRLDDPVRAHVPELRLQDEEVAREVTVRHLLNHTAGWDGSVTSGGGDPTQPLSGFVDGMAGLEQLASLGARPGYNNAALALAGRLVEKITRQPYEAALRSLLLAPLGLVHTGFTNDDLVPERCMVGHASGADASFSVARPWRWPRAANPEGGLVSTLEDQLSWAAFHLGDGAAADRSRILRSDELIAMRRPTVELVGSSLGEAIGLGWFLRDVGGCATAAHSGTTNGQHTELCLVPDHRLAVVVANNGTPAGMSFNRDAVNAVLDDDLGLRRVEPTPRTYDAVADGDITGFFESGISRLEFTVAEGDVTMRFSLLPAAATEMGDQVSDFEPCSVGFLPGERGEFIIVDGPFEGMMGYFAQRGPSTVQELDFGGRWHRRVAP